MIKNNSGNDAFIGRLNPTTGVVSNIHALGKDISTASLVFVDDNLYGALEENSSDIYDTLYQIDPNDGSITKVGASPQTLNTVGGMDAYNNTIYAVASGIGTDNGNRGLYTWDKATGTVNYVTGASVNSLNTFTSSLIIVNGVGYHFYEDDVREVNLTTGVFGAAQSITGLTGNIYAGYFDGTTVRLLTSASNVTRLYTYNISTRVATLVTTVSGLSSQDIRGAAFGNSGLYFPYF